MPHDPVRVADTRAWLWKAQADLRAGGVDLGATPPLTGDAAFHAQQAVEKTLKAFLTWHDEPFRKTHDLRELGTRCAALDASLADICTRAEPLTPYAWQFRYPGIEEEPRADEARDALALAGEVYDRVLARLPAEVRP